MVRQSRRREKATDDGELAIRHLSELRPGVPVVHQAHGVGRYKGLETIEAGGQAAEFVTLEYADGPRLYVPVDSLHLISRYAGADDELAPAAPAGLRPMGKGPPPAAEKIRDTAAELLDVYARREAREGSPALPPEAEEYARFAASFPFEETPDQRAAIQAVIGDLTAPAPWIGWSAAMSASARPRSPCAPPSCRSTPGRQVVVLVPHHPARPQHFENFRDRFADTAVKIELISRFTLRQGQAAP